ncbi:Bax inhibitor-1/YccA family protein [Thalassospiraceae bacterium LMO-SO8]|nr:Bax inhibitor-1/YccA family protein [Alphaproteobacteria bacterium LMO-S08]WND78038.1 Bax inhibitor-1/YccA family protein [Thalassospiraceae bacterium LMO-SO8]
MGQNDRFRLQTGRMDHAQAAAAGIDVGLRSYMLRVYNYMCIGLALTGAVAFAASTSGELMNAIHGTALRWVVMLAPLGFVFFLSARIHSMKAATAQTLFWVYAGLMGLSLSYIFLAFTGESIVRVFFITSAAFAGLSLYGYTTKKDLSGMGTFLVMGLIGIIIASVVNIFLASSGLHFVISILGVLIFAGLTAYDTQRIKAIYAEGDHSETHEKKAIMGALTLYLDFINMFIFMLQFFGNRE